MDVDDNFYDEIASFIPEAADYCLDDIDEILRSTETQLYSSFDLTNFEPQNFELPLPLDATESHGQETTMMMDQPPSQAFPDFTFPTFPSPPTTEQSSSCSASSASASPFTPHRSSSICSMDDDGGHFNPDEFMNFLNSDNIKIEDFPSQEHQDSSMDMSMPRRNTPSPTGSSCSSSTGSSTSGVQSDISSIDAYGDRKQSTTSYRDHDVESGVFQMDNGNGGETSDGGSAPFGLLSGPVISPVTVPPTIMPTATIIQPVNVLHGTLIPVKTLPLAVAPVAGQVKAIKVEPKLAPKAAVAEAPQPTSSSAGSTKPTSVNGKPKTIFLSTNDFKALMQKMNNGKGAAANGAKLTSGPMPKIIMKAPNGKVITANKMIPLGSATPSTTSAAQPFATPKVIKTSSNASQGPLIIKQQPQSGNVKLPSSSTPNYNIYKGIMDEKMVKKQQRMIKNRESASLSRKKKKEYVASLESRISNLEKENYALKGENSNLRSQLVAFAKTCHCKHGNVSEFILNSMTANGKVPGEHQHVKIAPKPAPATANGSAPKNFKQRIASANMRKNVAVLFAMAFMVTMNVGNFQHYLNKQNAAESALELVAAPEEPMSSGRRLLWVESESEFKEKLNRSQRSVSAAATDLEVPPLHFIRPVNRTKMNSPGGGGMPPPPLVPSVGKCSDGYSGCGSGSGSSNQTENLRLASKLHKWIDGNDFFNLSIHGKFGNDLDNSYGFKASSDYYEMKSMHLPLQAPGPTLDKQKRKLLLHAPEYGATAKQRKLDDSGGSGGGGVNSLELFKPKISEEYLRLFKGIKRQDDTFYVLSFNMDHILLPASAYNKSSRPKMSLMLPAGDPSLNGDVVLMQIDCEVVNTTEVELKADMIPEKLRPQKFHGAAPQPNDVANNETAPGSGSPTRPGSSANAEETKERPAVVRTYAMMGPKAKLAATPMHNKPRIIKLSDLGKIEATVQGKNSTLFAKMQETVAGELGP